MFVLLSIVIILKQIFRFQLSSGDGDGVKQITFIDSADNPLVTYTAASDDLECELFNIQIWNFSDNS